MHFSRYIYIVIIFIILLNSLIECQRGKGRGSRRRGKTRKHGSSRFIFYTNPKRREYYDNPNGAQIIQASHFDYEFYLGHKIVFICVATGDPMPMITWFKDSIELDPHLHQYLQISEWKYGLDRIKSKLEIDPARQMDSGSYECMANNKYSVDRRNFKADF
ncbi:immunoglobulin domain-containing protein oig-4-like [Oppia nitens]|uniref:immunoglobulin domain-containing protein oig-4-like n=1 Tax=Oppia nitens TaxID=1686743 RepID=UPI0023D9CA9F|nr:immunoglobulin domain-containing protein oig-4-like [Oppia nitens]